MAPTRLMDNLTFKTTFHSALGKSSLDLEGSCQEREGLREQVSDTVSFTMSMSEVSAISLKSWGWQNVIAEDTVTEFGGGGVTFLMLLVH